MRLQFLNGLGKKYVAYKAQKEFMLVGCPYLDTDHPDLLEITATGGIPCHFGSGQRLGVLSFGERGENIDTVKTGETLILSVGANASVDGRKWVSAKLKIDGTNAGASVRVTVYDGSTVVGVTTLAQMGAGEHLVAAGGRLFDRISLTADSGKFGLKGFTNAAIFYFPSAVSSAQASFDEEPTPTTEELQEGLEGATTQEENNLLFLPLLTR